MHYQSSNMHGHGSRRQTACRVGLEGIWPLIRLLSLPERRPGYA